MKHCFSKSSILTLVLVALFVENWGANRCHAQSRRNERVPTIPAPVYSDPSQNAKPTSDHDPNRFRIRQESLQSNPLYALPSQTASSRARFVTSTPDKIDQNSGDQGRAYPVQRSSQRSTGRTISGSGAQGFSHRSPNSQTDLISQTGYSSARIPAKFDRSIPARPILNGRRNESLSSGHVRQDTSYDDQIPAQRMPYRQQQNHQYKVTPASYLQQNGNVGATLIEGRRQSPVQGASRPPNFDFRQQPQANTQQPQANTQQGNSAPPVAPQNFQSGNPQGASDLVPKEQDTFIIGSPPSEVVYSKSNGMVNLFARNATVTDVLNTIAKEEGINFVLADQKQQAISFSLRNMPVQTALTSILAISGNRWTWKGNIVYVSPIGGSETESNLSPEYSGLSVKVFDLDYVSATEVDKVVKGMLSSTGESFVSNADPKDNRKTGEQIVVQDYPGSIERIASYIEQVDVAPRQVLIEAYVLEVDLDENAKHGVNFETIADISGKDLKLGTLGVSASGTSTFFAEIDTPNLKGLIDALKTSTDARTLASPKVMVINGQESRMQVGQQLGFRVVTTTQTSTLEDVKFIDVGVVLTVTPRIGRDNRVMMSVKPEVSSGQINVDTGLPEEETSEVETSVLLSNGRGMVIGGLIQEKDATSQSKVPGLGDLKHIGGLFRRSTKQKTRSEIIFVLIPRIVEPSDVDIVQNEIRQYNSQFRSHQEFKRGTTPLFEYPNCIPPRPSHQPQLSPIHRGLPENHRPYDTQFNGYEDVIPADEFIESQAPALEPQGEKSLPPAPFSNPQAYRYHQPQGRSHENSSNRSGRELDFSQRNSGAVRRASYRQPEPVKRSYRMSIGDQ